VTYSIHLVTGEKGGVGKSKVALHLVAYFAMKGLPFVVAECDTSNGDVGVACKGKHEVIYPKFTDNPDRVNEADLLVEASLERNAHVITNSAAQTFDGLAAWLRSGSIDAAQLSDVQLVVWFTSNGEKDSIALLYRSLESFGSEIQHILVRNPFFTDRLKYDYSAPERNEALAEILQRFSVPIVDLPRYAPTDLDIIRTHDLTFTEAITSPLLGVVSRSRVQRSLKEFFAQLNTLEVFSDGLTKKRTGTRKNNQKSG
jgi:CobQ/CobB/MinD/ParA nucleotide binding domain